MDLMQRVNDIGYAQLIGLVAIIGLVVAGVMHKSGGRGEE